MNNSPLQKLLISKLETLLDIPTARVETSIQKSFSISNLTELLHIECPTLASVINFSVTSGQYETAIGLVDEYINGSPGIVARANKEKEVVEKDLQGLLVELKRMTEVWG